jgi:hypothetical protein
MSCGADWRIEFIDSLTEFSRKTQTPNPDAAARKLRTMVFNTRREPTVTITNTLSTPKEYHSATECDWVGAGFQRTI